MNNTKNVYLYLNMMIYFAQKIRGLVSVGLKIANLETNNIFLLVIREAVLSHAQQAA